MKKILLFLFFIMLFGFGCSQENQTKGVTVWHWMTDRQESFLKLAQQYQEQTGIEVRFELYAPSELYSRKTIAAAQASVLPDIYGILGEKKRLASFIEGGFVANLSPDFEANEGIWEKNLFVKAINVNRFEEGNVYGIKPGIYGVPLDVTNIQMLYNKNILKKAGIDQPPLTFDQFIKDAVILRRMGIDGFVSGWGEAWIIECFASNYAFNIMGEEKIMATYRGEVSYTDPDWITVFNIFKILKDKNIFVEGIVTKGNKYAEQDFALERAAFAFNGSWCVNVYDKMNPDLNYGTMLPPRYNLESPMKIWGGAGSSLVVNPTSKNKQAAINFLKWLTAKEQQAFLSKQTKNLPANRHALSFLPKILSQFASSMEDATHPSIWKHNENLLVSEAFAKGIQSIIIGEKTPEEAARDIQAVKVYEMEKDKKRLNR